MRLDPDDNDLEEVVEQCEKLFFLDRCRGGREGTKIGEQDGRVNRASGAAQNGASLDFRGRSATNVSRKEAARRATHGVRFQCCADEREQSLEYRDVLRAEAFHGITDDTHRLSNTVAIVQRQSQVIRTTGASDLVEHRVIVGIELTQPTPERLPVLHHELKRISLPGAGTQQFTSDFCETGRPLPTGPYNIPSRHKGVGNALPEAKSPDRHLFRNAPLYETGDCLFRR